MIRKVLHWQLDRPPELAKDKKGQIQPEAEGEGSQADTDLLRVPECINVTKITYNHHI